MLIALLAVLAVDLIVVVALLAMLVTPPARELTADLLTAVGPGNER